MTRATNAPVGVIMTQVTNVLAGAIMTRVTNVPAGAITIRVISALVGAIMTPLTWMMEMPFARTTSSVDRDGFAAVITAMAAEDVLSSLPPALGSTDLSAVVTETPTETNAKPCPEVSAFRSKEPVPMPIPVEPMVTVAKDNSFVRKTLVPTMTPEFVPTSQLFVPWRSSLSVDATERPMETAVLLGVLV